MKKNYVYSDMIVNKTKIVYFTEKLKYVIYH